LLRRRIITARLNGGAGFNKKARVSFQEAAELCKQYNAQSISGVKQNLKLSILLRKINRTQEKLDKL
jgi:hypothetical protein